MDEQGFGPANNESKMGSRLDPEELQIVWTWLDKLPSNDPVRDAATAVAMGQNLADDAFQDCIAALHPRGRRPWQQKISAIWALGRARLNEAQQSQVAAELTALVRYRSSVYNVAEDKSSTKGLKLPVVALLIAAVVFGLQSSSLPYLSGPLLLLILVVGLKRRSWRKRTRLAVRLEAIRAMGRVGSFHVLDELAEQACNSPSKRVRQVAIASLQRPLACVNASHFGLVTRTTVSNLTRLLRSGDRALVRAILGAMVHIGDESCLGTINMLMAGWLSFGKNGGLEDAAAAAHEAIIARSQRTKEPRQLLRASATPISREDGLLRAAASTLTHGNETLIRPINSGEPTSSNLTLNILEDLAKKGTPEAIEFLKKLSTMPDASVETRTAAQNLLAHAQSVKELNEATPTMQW